MPRRAVAASIREIQVEHTPCFGTCPVYRYTFRVDGKAEYQGEYFVRRLGLYRGKVPASTFRQLARQVVGAHFRRLRSTYALPVTDMASVITTVKGENWEKRIVNYGAAGPPKLRQLERALDRCCERIRWRRIASSAA